jgi:hypothetical protein
VTGYPWGHILRILAPGDRQQLARRFGVRPEPEALEPALLADLPTRIGSLGSNAARLLERLWLAGGQASFELVYRQDPAAAAAVAELAREGLAVELRVDYYHHVLALPLEVQNAAFDPLILRRLASLATGDPPPATPLSPSPPWATDLFRILSYLRWQGGPLTQQGELYKRARTAMTTALWPDAARAADERLEALMGFAEWAGLINVNRLTRQIEVTTDAEQFWRESARTRWERWFHYWTGEALNRIAHGHVVFDLMTGSPAWRPLDLDGVAELLAGTGFISPTRARHAVQATATVGGDLGWIRQTGRNAGLSATAAAWLAGRMADATPNRAVVQPTGDIIVPVETDPALIWDAETVMSLKRADVVWTYRFDHDAVDRALAHGLSADDALSRLAALSRTELPPNLVTEVRDTWRKVGRVRVLATTVIWTASPELGRTIANGLGDLVWEKLGDTVLVLGPDDGRDAVKRLQKLGYLVRSEPEQPGRKTRSLADPAPAEYRYRPQVQASLPHTASARPTNDPAGIGETLLGAMRAHETIRIAYRAPGRDTVHAAVYPVALHSGVLYGILQDETRQSFQIPVRDILEVWRLA